MKEKPSRLADFLNVKEDNTLWLVGGDPDKAGRILRTTVGILGMALPLFLWIFLYIDTGSKQPLESISHYYYTRVLGIFVVILSLLAFFLIIYQGKAIEDFFISTMVGIAALLVVFFPTGNISDMCCLNLCCDTASHPIAVTILHQSEFRENFHYISAGIFLSCLAYMSICMFTKSNLPKEKRRGTRKAIRNRIYRVCGAMMIIALAVILLGGFFKLIPEDVYTNHQLTFWMETLAVESFGLSWLVKGEVILKDN
jgi:formate hydrogenlyase subunit 3/multisubunit Na+/H+ antiporter MnhD subunit